MIQNEYRIDSLKLAKFLYGAAVVLLFLNLLACVPYFFMGRAFPFAPLSFDAEQNIPTFFSTLMLVLCALFVAIIAYNHRGNRRDFWAWAVLAGTYLFLGFDEFSEIHERFEEPLTRMLNATGLFHFAWTIAYILLVVVFVLCYFRFFLRLPKDTKRLVLLGAVLYVGGAIGCEMINGAWIEVHGRGWVYSLMTTLEEFLEILGSTTFVYAFSYHIEKHLSGFAISFGPAASRP